LKKIGRNILLLTLFIISVSYARIYFKLGYGSLGYRLGIESPFGNIFYPKYLFLYGQTKDKEYKGSFTYILNGTSNQTQNLNYKYTKSYINLGISIPTKLWDLYLSPFIIARYAHITLENSTKILYKTGNWKVGGGIGLTLYLRPTHYLLILPQAYLYYLPEKNFYYKDRKFLTLGSSSIQKGFALDIDLSF